MGIMTDRNVFNISDLFNLFQPIIDRSWLISLDLYDRIMCCSTNATALTPRWLKYSPRPIHSHFKTGIEEARSSKLKKPIMGRVTQPQVVWGS